MLHNPVVPPRSLDRDDVSVLRDESAATRVLTAEERDRVAALRDSEAADRDRLAAQYEQRPDTGLAEVRIEAARNRAAAAADRARAAADREAAARERLEARRLQAEAEMELVAAATDELTSVWTRGFGLVQIAREIERAERTGGSLSLAFIDVDGLKEVNDSSGHPAGDRLLKLTAETLTADLRAYDIVVRYGGDEFVCAMPNIERRAAIERMTAVAATLAAAETGHSMTFGVAEHQRSEDLKALVARADADLLARRNERDRV